MRLPVLSIAALFAAIGGCTTPQQTTLTAGGTLGTDGMPLTRHAVTYGGVSVGARAARLGAETGVEVGRQSDGIIPHNSDAYEVVTTTLQPYLNLTYDVMPVPARRARLYGLAGARYLHQSFRSQDPNQTMSDGESGYAAVTLGAGVGFGPVSLELYGHVPVGPENRPLNPTTALRARVSLPVLRVAGR